MSDSDKNSIKLEEEGDNEAGDIQQEENQLDNEDEQALSQGMIDGQPATMKKRPHRKLDISNFIMKTYRILEDKRNNASVEWTDEGNCFIVKDKERFSKEILPKYFKHSKFSSFVRQLNMYDFHKIRKQKEIPIFKHKYFQEGRMDLLQKIKRKSGEEGKQEDFVSKDFINFSEPFISFESKPQISTTNIKPINQQVTSTKSEVDVLKKENADLQQSINDISQQIQLLQMSKDKKKEKLVKIITTIMFFDLNSNLGGGSSQSCSLRSLQDHFVKDDEAFTFSEYRNKLSQIYSSLKSRLLL